MMLCKACPPWIFIGIATCSGFGKWEASATNDIKSRWQLLGWVPGLPSMDKAIKSWGISEAPAACISLLAKEEICCTVWGDSCPQAHSFFNHSANKEGFSTEAGVDCTSLPRASNLCLVPPFLFFLTESGRSSSIAGCVEAFCSN